MILTHVRPRPGAPLPTDAYDAHRFVWRIFSDSADQKRDFLFRVEPNEITVLSRRPPGDSGEFIVESQRFDTSANVGDRLSFRLRVNPTFARPEPGKRGARTDAVRHALRLHRESDSAAPEESVIRLAGAAWLLARQERFGCEFDRHSIRVSGYRMHRLRPGGGRPPIRFVTLDLEGQLVITDAVLFRDALCSGIGHQKAFGCGLMLIGRAP